MDQRRRRPSAGPARARGQRRPGGYAGSAGRMRAGRPKGQGARAKSQGIEARRRRRRRRLYKALAAWAICILLMAGAAAGTYHLVRAVTTGKRTELRREGLEKLQQGDYSGAVASFDAALEQAGNKAEDFQTDVLLYRAEAEQGLKDYPAAAYTYGLLIEKDPGNAASYGYLQAVCYGAAGAGEQAYEAYQAARQADQGEEKAAGWMEGLLAAGGACVKSGQYERAMALYEDALGEGAENGQIYNQMGLCQMALEDYEGAGDSFDRGYHLAAASEAGGDGEEEVLKELAFNRAVVREYLQEYGEALELFEAYVSAYGADERAQHEIDFLETRV